ncbi:MAG: protein-L-isoaspartate(D-aspartate) O-methyltransferase [Candidatus Bathyarchaeia archaeon]
MDRFEELRRRAVEHLIQEGILHSPNVIRAMTLVPREEFLPDEVKSDAYLDTPLPIGYGQTTSALHMTAMFCEYAELSLGDRVLEVGGGCGYMSCVYAEVVAPSDQPKESWGHVWSAEIIKELAMIARENVKRCGYADRVEVLHRDASLGLEEFAPYDAIIVTSAAPGIPQELINQLKPGGCLLIPVGDIRFYQKLVRVRKHSDGGVTKEELGGVAFVPMRGKAGWK